MKKIIFLFNLLVVSATCFAMQNTIDISGIDKKTLLQALYQRAQPQGMGHLHYIKNHELTNAQLEEFLQDDQIGYLFGRRMKINISTNSVYTLSYNEGNGKNASE